MSFAFLTFFPFGLFAAAASAAALSWDACDAASRVGRLTRLERRGSGLMKITVIVVIYAQHRIDCIAFVACPLMRALELYISLFQ
jgi:hypothetical protein